VFLHWCCLSYSSTECVLRTGDDVDGSKAILLCTGSTANVLSKPKRKVNLNILISVEVHVIFRILSNVELN